MISIIFFFKVTSKEIRLRDRIEVRHKVGKTKEGRPGVGRPAGAWAEEGASRTVRMHDRTNEDANNMRENGCMDNGH